jgi:hypothetical protein
MPARADRWPKILGHELVHETGHMLQGIFRHSATGVTKAHWTVAEFAFMIFRPLRFTAEDVRLILAGLAQPPRNQAPTIREGR